MADFPMGAYDTSVVGWRKIETAPDNKGWHAYLVTDGHYVEKVAHDDNMGWYENGDGWNAQPLDPQPTHWMPDADLLKLIMLPSKE